MSSRYQSRYKRLKEGISKQEDFYQKKVRKFLGYTKTAKTFHKICKLFIKPIIEAEPMNELLLEEKLELIFSTNTRQIITFCAIEYFKIPGFVPYQERSEPVNFNIKAGDLLWVRVDVRTPNLVDIESLKNNCTYRLTAAQYAYILDGKIERLSPCKKENS